MTPADTMLRAAFSAELLGCAGFLGYLLRRRELPARLGFWAACAGLACHVVAYGLDCRATRAMVVMSPRGAFSLLSLLTAAVLLPVIGRHQLLILGAFVLPLVTAGTGVAVWSPPPAASDVIYRGGLFSLHVVTSYLGFSGFAASFGVALAYLVQDRQLRSRQPRPLAFVLPPLTVLDRLAAWLAGLGLVFEAMGVLTGMLFARETAGTWWPAEPKAVATAAGVALYAAVLLTRSRPGGRGRRGALLLVAGFLLVLFTFAGLPHAPPPRSPGG